ncbi:hypothetical protein EQV77_14110 [Halobacillus fulvus]|nr:hypothetical protein EQV77_14110 [Halobacillus fulvus]
MAVLYDLVKEAQTDYAVEAAVIDTFEPKIKKSLTMTKTQNREDLEQELKLHVIHYVRTYSLDDVPGLFDLEREANKG